MMTDSESSYSQAKPKNFFFQSIRLLLTLPFTEHMSVIPDDNVDMFCEILTSPRSHTAYYIHS